MSHLFLCRWVWFVWSFLFFRYFVVRDGRDWFFSNIPCRMLSCLEPGYSPSRYLRGDVVGGVPCVWAKCTLLCAMIAWCISDLLSIFSIVAYYR